MGHRNTQFTGHLTDLETDPQGHSYLHPGPSILYGSPANYPHPNMHSLVPSLGNRCNFNFHHVPEHHEQTLFYGMPPYNAIQPQHPALHLDLAVAVPSNHYNPHYAAPASAIRDFSAQLNQGLHGPLPLSNNQRIVGVLVDNYGRNIPSGDGVIGLFKRNIVDGVPTNYQHNTTSAGPSSSASPNTGRLDEPDITSMGYSSFTLPEYFGNDSTAMIENVSHSRGRNRPSLIGPEPVMVHNANHSIQGNYVSSQVQMPGNPWLDMHFGANNGGIGAFAWTQAPDISFMRAGVNGSCVETGNMGIQGYQVTAANRSSNGFVHLPVPQGHPNPHHPPPPLLGLRGYNANIPSHVSATSSRIISTPGASNTAMNPFQDGVDAVPAIGQQTGFRMYQPYRREINLDPNARQRNLPHMRVLPEDEVAMLEIPGYHEAGNPIDHHTDMRLDIDHMSYEELLALGEQIGSVGTGLTVEFIENKLKARILTSSMARFDLEEMAPLDEQIDFCVICQTDYEDGETIGTIECGHEYHRDCIKKWLVIKNSCPICKSTALSSKGKDL